MLEKENFKEVKFNELNFGSHEVKVGFYSIVGKTPLRVLQVIKEIYDQENLPAFRYRHQFVRVFMDELVQPLLEERSSRQYTLILNASDASHRAFAQNYQGNVSWYCEDDRPFKNYKGTFYNPSKGEVCYSKEGLVERYKIPSGISLSRELVAAFCAVKESEISYLYNYLNNRKTG